MMLLVIQGQLYDIRIKTIFFEKSSKSIIDTTGVARIPRVFLISVVLQIPNQLHFFTKIGESRREV
jgi:hypothetical protein